MSSNGKIWASCSLSIDPVGGLPNIGEVIPTSEHNAAAIENKSLTRD
jgi:hypothetical protein